MLSQTSVETAKRVDPTIPLPRISVVGSLLPSRLLTPPTPCDIAQLTIEFGMHHGSDDRPDGKVGDA